MVSKDSIKTAIMKFAVKRGRDKSFCPSEVARYLEPEDWRPLMPEIRSVADSLVDQNFIDVLQKGKVIENVSQAIGPIRLKIKNKL